MAFSTEQIHTPGTPPGTPVDALTPGTAPLPIRLLNHSSDAATVLDAIDASGTAPR